MKVLVEYPKHHYIHEWKVQDFFCPNCGKKSVWAEQGSGDYYVGAQYICLKCIHAFYLPSGTFLISDPVDFNIITQIKCGETWEPTTPKGN